MVKSKANDAQMAIEYWQNNRRCTIRKACDRYNITEPTFYKYFKKFGDINENEDNGF